LDTPAQSRNGLRAGGLWNVRRPSLIPGRVSVGGPDYPSLTAAILALDRIDFATGLHRLHYRRKSGAIACRTFMLDRFHGWLSHLNLSGESAVGLDAFPSGHAEHVGALASAASTLPVRQRNVVWGIGAGLVATRVVLLAHWASDVAAGLVVGAVTERILRLATGYGRERVCQQASQRALPPWPYLSSWRRAKQRNSSM
jgi:membrane-associated phospholipid phosphatase